MKPVILLSDFDRFREDYHTLRLGLLNHQPSGVEANERDLNLFSKYFHQQNIDKITGEGILDFLTYLRQERDNHAGSINRKEASIRSYLLYLRFVQVDGADGLPIESMPRARQPYPGPLKTLEPEEVNRLLDSIDRGSILGFRDFFLYTLIYRLGLRISEALNIDLSDIDFEKEILHIHGKGRRERQLPLLPDIIKLLNTWLIYRSKLFHADKLEALFISKKGNRLSVRTAQDNLKKIVTKAGPFSIDKVTPHSFRHAFATHAIEGEQDLVVLKAILGHASSKSTEIYCHPSMRVLRKAVNNHIASKILTDLVKENIVVLRVHQASYLM
jgi:site-specific recombinase XerD